MKALRSPLKAPQFKPRQLRPPAAVPREPILRFTPSAWAKLLFLRDYQDAEVGCFGVSDPRDLLLVSDVLLVRQEVSLASVRFDDAAVADFFDAQADLGRKPEQFARLWLHTHPGDSPFPSSTDEDTFARVFGGCQWAVMFILARKGKSYARIRFNIGPGAQLVIPSEVDFTNAFGPSRHEDWKKEFDDAVRSGSPWGMEAPGEAGRAGPADWPVPDDWMAELEGMDAEERDQLLGELSAQTYLRAEQGAWYE